MVSALWTIWINLVVEYLTSVSSHYPLPHFLIIVKYTYIF